MSEDKKKSKIKILLIIIIAILVLIILVCSGSVFYLKYKTKEQHTRVQELSMKNNDAMLNMIEKVEYGTEMNYEELLAKLIDKDKLLEGSQIRLYMNDKELTHEDKFTFNEVGTYKAKVIVTKEYTYTILKPISEVINNEKETDIIVEDTKYPVIDGVTDKEITAGDSINVLDGITAKDEVDGDLDVTQEGEIDTSKAGEYIVKIKAKDKNENETVKELKVTVNEKKEEPQKTTTNKNSESTSSKNSSSTSSSSSSKNSTSSNKGTSTNTNTGSNSGSSQSSNSGSSSASTQNSNDASTKNGRLNIAKAEAKKIVSKITKSGMSDYDKADAICQYLFNNVSRQLDQSTEAYKTNFGNEAYAALVLKKAACSGFCKAVTLMCDAAGLKSQHINANQWTHQWNKVYINGEWIVLDAQIRLIRRNKTSNRVVK